ncbi:C4-dicarboxylate transporter DctA [Paraburkholderia hospita]|jgi:aerobic C4-dicarboxylate transport protein|uniref:C4-dicarboxylate transport protein n=1 Tax=Paraburkholderia hospita TaxID=169430 RepID=A0AAN1MPL5_9BURK|nr:C4-dicarboxylate transporter DctA [Paraburkholderia hospita]SOE89726.1 Na+/H+-dicarboxylate symporter [Burkholderia sp. YR290]AUT74858.1 C4-dicarboxylate transporter DctA [Paraburkholderia hospita]EIM95003.1 C4-dicarboxylate transport protein [Paraburkholderia hospita]OUL80062.1 C4-dicarboxylate transporter DctA [Paraburkholderia hospita]OUL91878.1 C4-dicarboxylate transporter DctA [Paraburkholderia hospita]
MSLPGKAASKPRGRQPFYRDLSFQVLAGMALGVAVGYWFPKLGINLQPVGDAFIRVIQMLIGPIIFCTVCSGIAGVKDFKKVGRVAIKALFYFEVVTSLALVIGLVVINVLKPGVGMNVDMSSIHSSAVDAYVAKAHHVVTTSEFLLNVIPHTAISAFAGGDVLQVLFFSVLFAFGLAAIGERARPAMDLIDSVSSALFWIIGLTMKVAPLAAFGAIAFTVSKFGFGTLISLGKLILEFYLTCALFIVLILWPIAKVNGFSLLRLMRYIGAELLLVIGTSSSETVFPQLIDKLERLGCEKSVVGLVLPTAYTFNHDGTCLYFAAAAVFLAQATNTPMTWHDQLVLLAVLLLTSKGAAGVSGAAIAVLAATLAASNTIPVESIALILGIHKALSSAFVFTNIVGNSVATIVVANWEKALNRTALRNELKTGFKPMDTSIGALKQSGGSSAGS